jgi:hypothetical protein
MRQLLEESVEMRKSVILLKLEEIEEKRGRIVCLRLEEIEEKKRENGVSAIREEIDEIRGRNYTINDM